MSHSLPATSVWGETWRLGLATALGVLSFGTIWALVRYEDLGDFPSWWPWVTRCWA